jgi:hypothetical protein
MINGKIESPSASAHTSTQLTMKVIATVDTTLLCGVLDFAGKKYYLDLNDFNTFVLEGKKFNFINESDVYPSYLYNYKRFSLLEHIFGYNSGNINYVFKNDNPHDLRRSNVKIYHNYHTIVKENYNVIEYIQGHHYTLGNDAYVIKNPMWKIRTEKNEEQLLMYCEKDTLCILTQESYQKILDYERLYNSSKKMTFYKHQNGYILCSIASLFIHQIITSCHGNGKGTKNVSVDHIDRNPLNNTLENLRVATREEQEQNSKGIMDGTKRARKHNAKPLPEGITQDMMKRYVNYYHEFIDKEQTKSREYFKIEKHPKLGKIWIGTKSNKIPILEKLRMVNKVVSDLEDDIYPETNDTGLPTYVFIKNERDKPHMIFDKKENDKRFNLRMVLPENYNIEEQLGIFREKIKTKYDIELF